MMVGSYLLSIPVLNKVAPITKDGGGWDMLLNAGSTHIIVVP